MNNCQKPQQATSGNILIEVFEHKEVLRFHFSDVGESGLSAYELAVASGFVGTVDEWLESLVGPPVPVAQELGDDPNLAVSQKLLKDSISSMEEANSIVIGEAQLAANAAKASETAAGESATEAKGSQDAAKTSETNAGKSATAAKLSETNSSESETAAKVSQNAAKASETAAQLYETNAASSQEAATLSETNAKASEDASKLSETNAKESETAAKTSEINTSESAAAAQLSQTESKSSQEAAKLSETNAGESAKAAKASETASKASELAALSSAQISESSASSAADSADQAQQSAQSAASSAQSAADSESSASNSKDSAEASAQSASDSADRAEQAATIIEDKLDKSSVKDELGDSLEFVINQRRVTQELMNIIAWIDIPKQIMMADFMKQRYALNGKPCRLQDIFEFIRLSKAWDFTESGLKEYGIDEPRISGKGLLIEPEQSYSRLDLTGNSNSSSAILIDEPYITQAREVIATNGNNKHQSRYNFSGITRGKSYLFNTVVKKDTEYKRVGFGVAGEVFWTLDIETGYMEQRVADAHVSPISHAVNQTNDAYIISILFKFTEGTTLVASRISCNLMDDSGNETFDSALYPYPITIEDMLLAPDAKHLLTPIKTVSTTKVTRLPDTLRLLQTGVITIDADEGIVQDGNEFTGFGYIRKMEIK